MEVYGESIGQKRFEFLAESDHDPAASTLIGRADVERADQIELICPVTFSGLRSGTLGRCSAAHAPIGVGVRARFDRRAVGLGHDRFDLMCAGEVLQRQAEAPEPKKTRRSAFWAVGCSRSSGETHRTMRCADASVSSSLHAPRVARSNLSMIRMPSR